MSDEEKNPHWTEKPQGDCPAKPQKMIASSHAPCPFRDHQEKCRSAGFCSKRIQSNLYLIDDLAHEEESS